jgi:hypothetical protein
VRWIFSFHRPPSCFGDGFQDSFPRRPFFGAPNHKNKKITKFILQQFLVSPFSKSADFWANS